MFRTDHRFALCLVAALGCMSAPLAAQPAKPAPPPPAASSAAPASALELTPAQRKKTEELRKKTDAQLAPLRERLAAKRGELHALWSAPAPSRADILKKESELDALRQQLRQAWVDERLAYLALLTPEQRAAWKSRRGAGMGPGGMGPGGRAGMHHGGMGPGGRGMQGGMGPGTMGMGPGAMGMGRQDCLESEDCLDCGDCAAARCVQPAAGTAPAAPAR